MICNWFFVANVYSFGENNFLNSPLEIYNGTRTYDIMGRLPRFNHFAIQSYIDG